MATTHLPSILQPHGWNLSLDYPIIPKSEKVSEEEIDYNRWFSTETFPSASSSSAVASTSNPVNSSVSLEQAQITNALNVVQSSAVYTQPITLQNAQTSSSPISSHLPTLSLSVPQNLQGAFPIAFGYATNTAQPVQVNSNSNSALNLIQVPLVPNQDSSSQPLQQMVPQMILLPGFGFQQGQITVNPQFYNLMLTQFQSLKQQQQPVEETTDDKKRSSRVQRNNQRRLRQTRPKVVEAKGAVQCVGRNRKKGSQCRNAALMEYIGPRPLYCAEHIELDPNSLYIKCRSPYQKEVDDKKGCKEVVLKEFGLCYKHFGDLVSELVKKRDVESIRNHHDRILELLDQLEREAAAAKKKDGDLYQRKNKLIPKFQEMKKVITKGLEALEQANKDGTQPIFMPSLDAPMLNLSSHDDLDASLHSHANAAQSPVSDLESSDC